MSDVFDDPVELVGLPFDILCQGKLAAGPDQVVIRIVDLEIGVAVEVVVQEPGGKLHGDGERRQHQAVDLLVREGALHLTDEALGEGAELAGVEEDAPGIGLVLRGGAGDEPHGVAEVVHGHPGHDSVQVDDHDGPFCVSVEEHVVGFRVVMGDSRGDLPSRIFQGELLRLFFHRTNVLDLLGGLLRPSAGVGLHGGEKLFEPFVGVVEIGDGLVELGAVEIGKLHLEPAEGLAHGGNDRQVVAAVEGDGIHVVHHAPEVFSGGIVVLAGPGVVEVESHLPGIFLRYVGGHLVDVLHDLHRGREDHGVDLLEDIGLEGFVAAAVSDLIGAVDVAVGDGLVGVQLALDAELLPDEG